MRKTRIVSLTTAIFIIMSLFAVSSAATFKDVPADTYSWAVNEIESMSKSGIIKGYEDNTFRPDKSVSKLEALVLTARVLGSENPSNSNITETAIENFGDTIDTYKIGFGQNEIAYLMAKGILTTSELSSYISSDVASTGTKRYEMAVILTKALDAEEEVSKNVMTSLEYADSQDIPAYAKKYVEYVSNQGLMNGVSGNKFSPNTDVTRAQAAVMLNKLINLTNYTYQSGVVAEMDTASRIIKLKDNSEYKQYTVDSSVLLRFEGTKITINDIGTGYDAVATFKNGSLYAIDFVTAMLDAEIYGSVAAKSSLGANPSISVYEIKSTDASVNSSSDNKTSYTLSDNCVITASGSSSTFADIKTGSYIKLTVAKGKVSVLEILPTESTITGRISDIEVTPVCKITVEKTNGTTESYNVASNVTVTKNSSKMTIADVVVGDTVSVTTTYGFASKLVATSKTQEKSGVITEVIISANPRITMKIGESYITYPVTKDCQFVITGKAEPNFYDLRAGTAATVKIESDTIVQINTDSSDEINQISGTVMSVNTSYNLVQITYVDSLSGTTMSEPVFVKNKASIIDISNGSTIKLSNIKTGSKITAFGSRNNGVFEATTINVVNN